MPRTPSFVLLALAIVLAAVTVAAPAKGATWTVPQTISKPHTSIGPVALTRAASGSMEAWWGWYQRRGEDYVPGHAHARHPVTAAQFGSERRAPTDLLDLHAYGSNALLGLSQSYAPGRLSSQTFRVIAHLGRMGAHLSGPDIVETAQTAYLPQLAVASNGRAIVAYIVRSGSRRIVRVATRGRSGRFGHPSTIFGTGRADVVEAAINARGDMLVAIVRNRRVRVRLRRAQKKWGPVQTLATASGRTKWQLLAAIDAHGRAEVVWRRHVLPAFGVHGRRALEAAYVPAGATRFVGRQVIESDGATLPQRLVEVPGGFAIAYAKDAPDTPNPGTNAFPRARFAMPRFGPPLDAAPSGGGLRDVGVAWDASVGLLVSWVQPTPQGDGGGLGRAAILTPNAAAFGPVEDVTPVENVSELAVEYDPRNDAPVAVWAARPEGTGPGVPIAQLRTYVRAAERLP